MTEMIPVTIPPNAPDELKVNGIGYWISDPLGKDDLEIDLPFYFSKYLGCFYQPNRIFHKWMVENHIQYEISYNINLRWHFIFEKKSDAILFKLRWY